MPLYDVLPRCRYCGVVVAYFGQICDECKPDDEENE